MTSSTLLSLSHSSVSAFGTRYQQPLQEMALAHSVEALVEGSNMSELQEGAVSIVLNKRVLNVSRCREVYEPGESMAYP